MKKRILLLVVICVMILTSVPTYVSATETNDSITEKIVESDIDSSRAVSYSAIIMQGNTPSASDCNMFYQKLRDSGRGYNTIDAFGWSKVNGTANTNRVTEDQLTEMPWYTVAYYSGHGKWRTNSVTGDRNPVVNYAASSSYGNFQEINIA